MGLADQFSDIIGAAVAAVASTALDEDDQLVECESKYASLDVVHNWFECKVDVLL